MTPANNDHAAPRPRRRPALLLAGRALSALLASSLVAPAAIANLDQTGTTGCHAGADGGPAPSRAELRDNVTIGQADRADGALANAVPSPNHAYRYRMIHLPTGNADPAPRAEILVDTARDHLVRIRVDDGRDVVVEWLSEKLLHMRVAWDRIAASDVVVDVEDERIIFVELNHYGYLLYMQLHTVCDAICGCTLAARPR